MDISVTLIMALSLCVLPGDFDSNGTVDFNDFAVFAHNWLKCDNGGDPADQNDVDAVTIALTRLDVNDIAIDVNDQTLDVNEQTLDVNDQTLELRYKITNDSDQDIWVCNGVGWIAYDDDEPDYEAYLEEEDHTLVVRRRLDVPTYVMYYIWPQGRYVRSCPGQERSESLLLTLPVRCRSLFFPRFDKPGVVSARRLIIEIGYHTKDLPEIERVYVRGPDKVVISALDMAIFMGEHVLQIKVDGVLVPYEEMRAGYARARGDEEKRRSRDKQNNEILTTVVQPEFSLMQGSLIPPSERNSPRFWTAAMK